MPKDYFLAFGSNPSTNTGLTPTFIVFATATGQTLTPPAITEAISGTGVYTFSYGSTASIFFGVDGGSGLAATDRYIYNRVDPVDAVDQVLGSTLSSFGSTLVDPVTVMGLLKRNQEFNEGDAIVDKSAQTWSISSRGASTLLRVKNLTNTSTQSTKS